MNILTKNGRVLMMNGAAVAIKPYAKLWGYRQAVAAGRTELYDWIYACLRDGFSVETRTVEGYDQPILVDGGAVTNAESLRWLVIPVYQFNIADTTDSRNALKSQFSVIVRENADLCYSGSSGKFRPQYDTVGNMILSIRIMSPPTAALNNARAALQEGIAEAKATVYAQLGISVGDTLTRQQKRNVAKVLHDWLLVNTSYRQGATDDLSDGAYWAQTAYSALTVDNPKPVCAGYASAYAWMMNAYGINCIHVDGTGRTGSGHAWNLVSLDLPYGDYTDDSALWTCVDVTHDDTYYDALFSIDKDYDVGDYCVYDRLRWDCIVPVTAGTGWTGEENWTPRTDLGHNYHPWLEFGAPEVSYGSPDNPKRTALGGFCTIFPMARCEYYGNTIYGVAEADWTAPEDDTQGGGAV